MLTEQPNKCFVHFQTLRVRLCTLRKTTLSPQEIITDRSKAVVLLWFFSIVCFWFQSFGEVSPYVCSYYFCSVCVAEWQPFGNELLTRLTKCYL